MGYVIDYSTVLTPEYIGFLLAGLLNTFALFALAWIFAFTLAAVLAMVRELDFPPTRWLIDAYVEYHRNVPLLVQVLVWYFGAPQLLPVAVNQFLNQHNAEFLSCLIALSLFSAAYMSEDLRSGLRAIPPTQFEAATAMGFGYVGAMVWIIIPQVWRLSLPPLINQTVGLLKGTSVAAVIGVGELTYQARFIENETFKVIEVFSIVMVAYLCATIPLMLLGARIAKRLEAETRTT